MGLLPNPSHPYSKGFTYLRSKSNLMQAVVCQVLVQRCTYASEVPVQKLFTASIHPS